VSELPSPSKELGQHFLIDDNIVRVIGRMADVGGEDVVLEIGPGQGVLTAYLAEHAGVVHAVELDHRLEPHLRDRFSSADNVRLHFGDALRLDAAKLEPPPTKLVANLPYNVATPIVVESLQRLPTVGLWCVMVQREVADRFFAEPRTKAYGAVSVLIQLAAVRRGTHPVSREVFRPRPNVDSALVAFRRRETPPPIVWDELKAVVEAAFAHRRKRLPNSLELAGLADRRRAEEALAVLGRPATTRAEELSPPEFLELAAALR
jgi:16S rRNA (adenine1518-N6/adenine1519-N6)-dimethyltransferase